MPVQQGMTAGQQNLLTQASLSRAQKAQQAQLGLDMANNPGQSVQDQIQLNLQNAQNQSFGWAPFSEAVQQYQDKGGKVDLGSALKSIKGLDSAGTGSQQPGQVVTDTGNPPPPPGVPSQPQGGAGDGGSNGVGVANAANLNGTPLPAVGDPRGGVVAPTVTQKNARMPASMKGLGY